MALHGWTQAAEQLSALAARGEWDKMPSLFTDEMLAEFCVLTQPAQLARDLRDRYEGIATRLALYEPFVPGEKDAFWRDLSTALG